MKDRAAPPSDLLLKVIVAGVGGQGVVFATRLLAQTAADLGLPVLASESHGMSQRGGSVISHLTVGSTQAPLIRRGAADLLLALDFDEGLRNLPFLRAGGWAVLNGERDLPAEILEPVTRHRIRVHTLPASRMALDMGAVAVANVVLIGLALALGALPLPVAALRETLGQSAPRGRGLNLQALQAGLQAAAQAEQTLDPARPVSGGS